MNKTNTGNFNTGDYNTGSWNTGYHNTGNHNTGNLNTGYLNTGYLNSGDLNTGSWNTSDFHVGYFNTIDAEKIYCFNTLIDKTEWDQCDKPSWLYKPFLTTWVPTSDMTDEEKKDHPEYETTGGYLRINNLKEEWRKAYKSATPEEIQAVRDLPAFDYEVFEEITGLDLRKNQASCEGREIEIDGVTYVLKKKENE